MTPSRLLCFRMSFEASSLSYLLGMTPDIQFPSLFCWMLINIYAATSERSPRFEPHWRTVVIFRRKFCYPILIATVIAYLKLIWSFVVFPHNYWRFHIVIRNHCAGQSLPTCHSR